MSKFLADASFWELFPQAQLGVVLLKGINNGGESVRDIKVLLSRSNADAEKFLVKNVFSENPVIAIWRDAYRKFKTKKGVRCSIEALLKRVETKGGDDFFALGDEEHSQTLEGELCYRDNKGAVCRCFNWRDGQRTMITENTKNAFIIMENLDPTRLEDLKAALALIGEYTQKYLGAAVTTEILTQANPSIEL